MKVMDSDLPDAPLQAFPISKDLYKRNGVGDRVDMIEPFHYDEIGFEY